MVLVFYRTCTFLLYQNYTVSDVYEKHIIELYIVG